MGISRIDFCCSSLSLENESNVKTTATAYSRNIAHRKNDIEDDLTDEEEEDEQDWEGDNDDNKPHESYSSEQTHQSQFQQDPMPSKMIRTMITSRIIM